MRLSRTITYAIHALLLLADAPPEIPIPRSQLAASGQLPERFLREILHRLATHKLIRSTRGADGGFTLARQAEQITLREVLEAFDFPRRPYVPSIDGQSEPTRNRLFTAIDEASIAALSELEKVSLAELQRPKSNGRPKET